MAKDKGKFTTSAPVSAKLRKAAAAFAGTSKPFFTTAQVERLRSAGRSMPKLELDRPWMREMVEMDRLTKGAPPQSSKSLLTAEVKRRVAAGEHYDGITDLSRTLHEWMKTVTDKPLQPRSIENYLRGDLFSLLSKK